MSSSTSEQTSKSRVVRDLTIVGDFIKYLLIFFVPFFIIGLVYGLLYDCYFMCMLFNPFIYAAGISSVIIVIKHDVNDIMGLIGRATEPQLALHIKYHTAIQKISLEMSSRDFKNALKTVNGVLKETPNYANALNLKGQILLEGFREYEDARACFEKVMKLAKQDTDDYKLAQELRASTFKA